MASKRNEKTSARVAAIAGKVLKRLDGFVGSDFVTVGPYSICMVSELKALAASALTQTETKRKVKK